MFQTKFATTLLIVIFVFANSSENVSNQIIYETSDHTESGYQLEVLDLLGIVQRPMKIKAKPSLRNSAAKFLLEVYAEVTDDEKQFHRRTKRNIDFNFITNIDRREIDRCNNVITFSSKPMSREGTQKRSEKEISLHFHLNDVPADLILQRSELRIYRKAIQSEYLHPKKNRIVKMIIFEKFHNRTIQNDEHRLITSLQMKQMNSDRWLELNITNLIAQRLQENNKSLNLILRTKIISLNDSKNCIDIKPNDAGIVSSKENEDEEFRPFIIGYFNGPELLAKFQHLRLKRDTMEKKLQNEIPRQTNEYRTRMDIPKTCQLMNFTIDFKELQMHDWIIAPNKFEAYFCGGECIFPLGATMNATNHAIVQTLMHLQQPQLPKPGCVPTGLGSVSILQHLDEDTVNLKTYPQTVAKACGCH